MVQSKISLPLLKKLITDSSPQRQELMEIYGRMPQTHCRRQTHCCALLPEMTLLESLQVLKKMEEMPASLRIDLIKQIIHYFFINPAKITACPFLKGQECLIYPDRFFGCRVYGLWSKIYYEDLFENSRRAKRFSRQQWEKLGVTLPKKVVEFQVPYCSLVKSDSSSLISDEFLLRSWDDIENLSLSFHPGHFLFKNSYLSDLSFLLTGLTFGLTKAVQLKFLVVQDVVQAGHSKRLNHLLNQSIDLLAEY